MDEKIKDQRLRLYLGMTALLASSVGLYLSSTPYNNQPLPAPVYPIGASNNLASPKPSIPAFKDITLQANLDIPHLQSSKELSGIHESLGSGACAFDYNNDGWVDLLTLNGSGKSHFFGKTSWWQKNRSSLSLYKNNTDNTFTDVTRESNLVTTMWTMGCAHTDLDNDGFRDLIITAIGENRVWKNNGDGTFTEKTNGLKSNPVHSWSTGVSVTDINDDGLADFYITNFLDFKSNQLTFEENTGYKQDTSENFNSRLYQGQKNLFYINEGNFKFVEKAMELGIDNGEGRGLFSLWTDLNDDSTLDLIIANGASSENKVFLQNSRSSFTDISSTHPLSIEAKTGDVSLFDSESLSFFISTEATVNPRLTSNSRNRDTAVIQQSLDELVLSNKEQWGGLVADFNHDGLNDVFISNGSLLPGSLSKSIPSGQKNTLLINNKNKGFINQEFTLHPEKNSSESSRCATPIDIDNNGSIDLFVTNNNDLGQLLLNKADPGQWIGFEIAGPIDFTITMESASDKGIQKTTKSSRNSSFLCSGENRVVFSLNNIGKETVSFYKDSSNQTKESLSGYKFNQYNRFSINNNIIKSYAGKTQEFESISILKNLYNKLKISEWLILNNKSELAIKELRYLMQTGLPPIRSKAVTLATKLHKKDALWLVQQGLSDDSKAVVLSTLESARLIEHEHLSRWISGLLTSNSREIACKAADVYAYFFKKEEAMIVRKYQSIDRLIQMVYDKNDDISACGIQALGHSEHYKAVTPLLEMAKTADKKRAIAAIQALGRIKERRAEPSLQAIYQNPVNPIDVRAHALIAKKKINPQIKNQLFLDKIVTYALKNQLPDFILLKPLKQEIADKHILEKNLIHNKENTQGSTKQYKATPNTKKIEQPCITCNKVSLHDRDSVYAKLYSGDRQSTYQVLEKLSQSREKWAHSLFLEYLFENEQNLISTENLFSSIGDSIHPVLKKKIKSLFTQDSISENIYYVAKKLIKNEEDPFFGIVWNLYMDSIGDNEDTTMVLAEALLPHSPDRVLGNLLK